MSRKILYPLLIVCLMIFAWYSVISDVHTNTAELEECLAQARNYASMGSMKYAAQYYAAAIEMNPSPAYYSEMADWYASAGDERNRIQWCEQFLDAFPAIVDSYEYMAEAYRDAGDYENCFDVLNVAQKRGLSSERLDIVFTGLEYVYSLDFNSYDSVGIYSSNLSPVQTDELWGFVNRFGESWVSCRFKEVGCFSLDEYAPVVDKNGDSYFIDKNGAKVLDSPENYRRFGYFTGNIIAAELENGRFTYLDSQLKEAVGDYDYASTFNGGVAAVRSGDKWQIINEQGNPVTEQCFDDVILDEKEIACRKQRLFVKTEGAYIMLDTSGKRISSLSFDDACLFAGGDYAAVSINGSWCFIDADGNKKSDYAYEGARSYANGMAAVKILDRWGFVDMNESLCIPAEFYDVKDFNEKGGCFVNTGDSWRLLKLYRLNRKENK